MVTSTTSLSEHQALPSPAPPPAVVRHASARSCIHHPWAGGASRITAERFIQRNLLGDDISRYIPQDVKIAVAIRDQDENAQVGRGRRCRATLEPAL